MKSTTVYTFMIILLVLVVPITSTAAAQEITFAQKAKQKSVEVTINEQSEVRVKHIVASSANSPRQVELLKGTVENIIQTNEEGAEQQVTRTGNNDAVIIFPSNQDSIIQYDLKDALVLKDNTWTMDFLYLEKTDFFFPKNIDLVFVNDRPVHLYDKKGVACHGCQMVLEYSLNVPTKSMQVSWEDRKFFVELRTWAEIENFNFDQPKKEISFRVNEENQFVTVVIVPQELLWGPYATSLNDEKIYFNQYINNGTHVWITMKTDEAGDISIIGTTAIPEFSIIVPMVVVGLILIMTVPRLRKFNLH